MASAGAALADPAAVRDIVNAADAAEVGDTANAAVADAAAVRDAVSAAVADTVGAGARAHRDCANPSGDGGAAPAAAGFRDHEGTWSRSSHRTTPATPGPSKAESAEPSDEELCRQLSAPSSRAAQEAAFTRLVERHQHHVFSFCARLLSDRAEAEDLAQEIFVAVLQNASSFRGESTFKTWLFRIARNHTLNRLKYLDRRGRRKTRPIHSLTEHDLELMRHRGDAAPETAFASIDARQRSALVQSAIDELAADQRLVVVLRHVEDLSYEEIAEVTGLPLGTIKSRIHRARAALSERLARWLT